MFTGIIQKMGHVIETRRGPAGVTLSISATDFSEALRPGDSVAINGTCHTVERCDADQFDVTSVGETLTVTTMDALSAGDRVNLEQAATLDTALGGHIVQGHVDGMGTVVSFETQGEDRLLKVNVPEDVADVVVPKGSITIDGVSLTVIDIDDSCITITVIPFTCEHTVIGAYKPGTKVNLEADVIGKYVRKYVNKF